MTDKEQAMLRQIKANVIQTSKLIDQLMNPKEIIDANLAKHLVLREAAKSLQTDLDQQMKDLFDTGGVMNLPEEAAADGAPQDDEEGIDVTNTLKKNTIFIELFKAWARENKKDVCDNIEEVVNKNIKFIYDYISHIAGTSFRGYNLLLLFLASNNLTDEYYQSLSDARSDSTPTAIWEIPIESRIKVLYYYEWHMDGDTHSIYLKNLKTNEFKEIKASEALFIRNNSEMLYLKEIKNAGK